MTRIFPQLVRPYRGVLALAFLAMLIQTAAELLEPWPLKVVFDNVFGSKAAPPWLTPLGGASRETVLTIAALALVGRKPHPVLLIELLNRKTGKLESFHSFPGFAGGVFVATGDVN